MKKIKKISFLAIIFTFFANISFSYDDYFSEGVKLFEKQRSIAESKFDYI